MIAELVVSAECVLHEGESHAGEVRVHLPAADDLIRFSGETGGDYYF